jgi:hypothetical protein
MFSGLPQELISKIALDAIILLKNDTWRELHEELLLQRVTPKTELGCIFLTRPYPSSGMADMELANVEYTHVERIPELI